MMNARLFSLSLMLLGAASGFSQGDRFKFAPKDSVQQREYEEFLNTTKAVRELDDNLSYLEAKMFFEFNGDEEPLRPYVVQKEKAKKEHELAIYRFIERHPSYAVSAAYVKHMYQQDFKYTADDYDYFAHIVSECPDTSYTNFLSWNLELVKQYTIGAQYTDFEGLQPSGDVKMLSQLMQKGKYTLIDFWASWCGPCRSAIPRVKAMREKYPDLLQVVSVSVDEKESAWRKAEKDEAMPWPQLWAGDKRLELPAQAYRIQSIPRLVLIAPDGKILSVTFKPSVIEQMLAHLFSVTVHVPDITAGAKVTIETTGKGSDILAETKATDGAFALYGVVDRPTYARIKINDKAAYDEGEYPKDRGIEFCIEPGQDISISAACYDGIPRNWEMNGSPLPKEPNVTVSGGLMQQHFLEYRQATREAELRYWQANRDWREAEYGFNNKPDPQRTALLKPSVEQAEQELTDAVTRFIDSHPDYSISLRLQQERMEDLFKYSDAELDHLLSLFAHNEDSLRYEQFQQQVQTLRQYTSGTPYTDLDVVTPEGRQCHLSDFITYGKPVFVDFWASWCGPCRSAIPKVKEMARKYGNKLTILSISVDRDEKAWRRAMDEEQMPWQQLLIPQNGMAALAEGYQVNSIPYLLIINAGGRVVMSSHSPEEVHQVVASMCEQ